MMVSSVDRRVIDAPSQIIWKELFEPGVLVRCLSDQCTLTTLGDDRRFVVCIGTDRGRGQFYEGTARLAEVDDDDGWVCLVASAREQFGCRTLQAEALVRVANADRQTMVDVDAKVTISEPRIGGPVDRTPDSLGVGMAERFSGCLSRLSEDRATGSPLVATRVSWIQWERRIQEAGRIGYTLFKNNKVQLLLVFFLTAVGLSAKWFHSCFRRSL